MDDESTENWLRLAIAVLMISPALILVAIRTPPAVILGPVLGPIVGTVLGAAIIFYVVRRINRRPPPGDSE